MSVGERGNEGVCDVDVDVAGAIYIYMRDDALVCRGLGTCVCSDGRGGLEVGIRVRVACAL